MWKILKVTIIRRSTDPIKIERSARSFLSRQSQRVEQTYYLEKVKKFPSKLLILYENAPDERWFSLEYFTREERTYLLDWNTEPPPSIHQTFLPMTLGFFKIKTDFERKKISGRRINQENVTDRCVLLRKWSSGSICNSSSIAGISVWLLKRTVFTLNWSIIYGNQ